MPNYEGYYKNAIAPLMAQLNQDREFAVQKSQEEFRRQQLMEEAQRRDAEIKRREALLKRKLQDQQVEAAIKVLTQTGSLDPASRSLLSGTPYAGLLGPDGSLKKSPEQAAQEEFLRKKREFDLQRGQQQVDKGRRELELPQLLQQIFQSNPEADYRKIGPQLVGSGAVKPDVLLRLGQGDRHFNTREGRMTNQFNARQQATQTKPPSTAQRRLDEQNRYADVVVESMMPNEEDIAESSDGTLEGYIDDIHAAQRTSAKLPTAVYARFIERLEALRQGQ